MLLDLQFVHRISGQLVVRTLGIGLLFAQDALVIKLFGAQFFGQLAFYMAAVQIAAMVGTLGQNNYVVFLLERYRYRGDVSAAQRVAIYSTLIAALGSFVIGLVLAGGAVLVSDRHLIDPLLLAITAVSVAVFEVLRQFFRVIERELVTEALLLIVQPVILIAISIATWFWLGESTEYTAEVAALMYLASTGIAMMGLTLAVVTFKLGLPQYEDGRTSSMLRKQERWGKRSLLWLRQGTPLVFSGLFTIFQQRVDIFVLGFFISPAMLAVYQVLARISLLGLFVLRSVQSVFLARFARHFIKGERVQAGKIHIFSTIISILGVVAAFLGALVMQPVFKLAFEVSIFAYLPLFLLLFLGRLVLASAGGAPLFLQMTHKRSKIAGYFLISVVVFFVPYSIAIATNSGVDALTSAIALVLFNATYAVLSFTALRRLLST